MTLNPPTFYTRRETAKTASKLVRLNVLDLQDALTGASERGNPIMCREIRRDLERTRDTIDTILNTYPKPEGV